MSWKCFELMLEAKSPIHIGYGARLGIIERTRYYMPGKTMWGAVVAKLAQEFCGNFEGLKEFVKNNLIFSYFYIMDKSKILFPAYGENGLKFGDLLKEDFENKFITSYVSTAIDKTTGSAEEGSLHEFELIKDKYLDNGKIKNTLFIGYLFVKEGSGLRLNDKNNIFIRVEKNECFLTDEKNLFDIIKNLQVGGERIYGFGKLRIREYKILDKDEIYNELEINLANEKPILKNRGEYLAFSHVQIDELNIGYLKGDLEPLVGREWGKGGAGQDIRGWGKNNKVVIGLSPGTLFKTEDPLCISEYGIWKKYTK